MGPTGVVKVGTDKFSSASYLILIYVIKTFPSFVFIAGKKIFLLLLKAENREILPITKHMVAVMGITAQVRPMEGLYTASAVPTMKPPPTHVAETHTHTHKRLRQ